MQLRVNKTLGVLRALGLLTLGIVALPDVGGGCEPEPGEGAELAPGVRIERAPPNPEAEARLARLKQWRGLYEERLTPLRQEVARLFESLQSSSLVTLQNQCRTIRALVEKTDRRGLFGSSHVAVDRVVYGSLERFRDGAAQCVAGRNLNAYRLLLEARAGLQWVDRRVEHALAPRVRLPGLADRD